NGTGKADQNEGGGQQEEGGSRQQAKFGIGISGNVSINDITDATLAFINNGAQVLTDGNIGISAQDTSWAVSAGLAAALAIKGKTAIALAGAFARNDLSNTTSSGLGAGVLVDASGKAKATAEQADKILSIAGSLSIGGKAGIGAA